MSLWQFIIISLIVYLLVFFILKINYSKINHFNPEIKQLLIIVLSLIFIGFNGIIFQGGKLIDQLSLVDTNGLRYFCLLMSFLYMYLFGKFIKWSNKI